MKSFGCLLIGIVVGCLASYGFTSWPSNNVDYREGGGSHSRLIDQGMADPKENFDLESDPIVLGLDPDSLQEMLVEEVFHAESLEKNTLTEIGDPWLNPDNGTASYTASSRKSIGRADLSPENDYDALEEEPFLALGDPSIEPESDLEIESSYRERRRNIGSSSISPESI